MCREAGARVATNVFLQDMNMGLPLADSRRIEALANGLPLWQGAQVAVDTALVGDGFIVRCLCSGAGGRQGT